MSTQTPSDRKQFAFGWNRADFDIRPLLKGEKTDITPCFKTSLGALYAADCLSVLPLIKNGIVDTVFADPPFNLGKTYGKRTDDKKSEEQYLSWCETWLSECIRVLRPG